MNKSIIAIGIFIVLSSINVLYAQSVVIEADDESFNLRGFAQNGVWDGVYPFEINESNNEIKANVIDNDITEEWWRGIIQFDLNGINEEVESAKFRIYFGVGNTTEAGSREFFVDLYASAQNRGQSMAHDDPEAPDEFDSSIGVNNSYQIMTADFVTDNDPVGEFYEFDVTDFINDRINEYGSTGNSWVFFRIQPNNFTFDTGFNTRYEFLSSYTISGYKPELVLEPGDETFEQDITGNEGFRMLSSPVSTSFVTLLDPIWTQGATNSDYVGDTETNSNVLTWDNTSTTNNATNWDEVTDLSETIDPGMGFLVYVYGDDDNDGTPDGFPKTLSISGTENSTGFDASVNTNDEGWTLLGNPFASSIDFDEIDNADLTGTIYIWDVNDESGSGDTGTNDPGTGSWKTYESVGGTGDITDGIIAPFQGFFVQNENTSPTVSFTESSKTTGDTFYGKETPRQFVRLELNGEGMSNSTWLHFSETGAAKQTRGDALQLEPLSSNYAVLAARKADGNLMDISHLPKPNSDFDLPLKAEVTKAGTYELTTTDFSLAADLELYLFDRYKGKSVRLDENFRYEFELQTAAKVNPNPLDLIKNGLKSMKAKSPNTRFVITSEVSVNNESVSNSKQFALEQNYPNPFNPTTEISYQLPVSRDVSLKVFDMLGREVATLVNGRKAAGEHEVSFDASTLSSGIYIYRLTAGSEVITRQMTLIK